MAATTAATTDSTVSSNAGATTPVMSSPVPRASSMTVAIPATSRPPPASARYLTILKTSVAFLAMANLARSVARSRMMPTSVSVKIQRMKAPCPRPLAPARSRLRSANVCSMLSAKRSRYGLG